MGGRREALLFDLDGTLIDSAPAIAKALNIQRERRGLPPLGTSLIRPWISLGADALIARALASSARDAAADLAEFRGILAALPADADILYPNVVASLSALASAGWKMAVVTNKPAGLSRQLLTDIGLDGLFATVIGGDTTAYAKPHSAPLLRALELLDTTSDLSLFIGDSDVDYEAARRLAIPFILFTRGYGISHSSNEHIRARFDDHVALPELIRSLA